MTSLFFAHLEIVNQLFIKRSQSIALLFYRLFAIEIVLLLFNYVEIVHKLVKFLLTYEGAQVDYKS